MKNIVIAGYARSPFDFARKGLLAKVRPDDMAAQVIDVLIGRSNINPDDIEDVIVGCAFPEGEQGFNVARIIEFIAGIPISAGATTVNRFCGSSMQAIHMAAGSISLGAGELFVCAGVESMSRVPMGGYNPAPNPQLHARFPEVYIDMGTTAENLASEYGISRSEQQDLAIESHAKADAARDEGKLQDELVPIIQEDETFTCDGCIRPDTSKEALDNLMPAFDAAGTVTAGTSSPLTDGAAAVLVCSESYADDHGVEKLARVKSTAIAGCRPEVMGIGPVDASQKALQRAGLEMDDIDVIELNEAFAAQALAVARQSGMKQKKINLDGGAIALGHPLGATGARITGKAASLLRRESKQYALATQCIGGGQGIATVLEAI